MTTTIRIALLWVAVLLVTAPVGAGTPEFKVNTYDAGNPPPVYPRISTNASGTSVIVWQAYDYNNECCSDIFGQVLDTYGNLIGPEIHVNTTTDDYQLSPSVAIGRQGNFVVTWESRDQDGEDGGIFARLFNADSSPASGEFQVNTHTARHQSEPVVAMDWNSNFVIVWASLLQDGDGTGVYGQRFSASGYPSGPEFRVNTATVANQQNADVAMDISGNFVVLFESYDSLRVWGQRYDRGGTPLGPNFLVTPDDYSQNWGRVGVDASGNFTVAWQRHYVDDRKAEILARRYTQSGIPDGPVFQVNTYTDNNQTVPDIAVSPAGDFVVVWESYVQDGLIGRTYDRLGVPEGSEILLNTDTLSNKAAPRVGVDASHRWTATWFVGAYGARGIYARTFGDSTASATDYGAPLITDLSVSVHPNPFNPSTTIAYNIPVAAYVDLVVVDVRGRLVARLYTGPRPEGPHTVVWNGLDHRGAAVSSGVYFYRLEAGERTQTGKMLLVK